jgi:hypothetical protein
VHPFTGRMGARASEHRAAECGGGRNVLALCSGYPCYSLSSSGAGTILSSCGPPVVLRWSGEIRENGIVLAERIGDPNAAVEAGTTLAGG